MGIYEQPCSRPISVREMGMHMYVHIHEHEYGGQRLMVGLLLNYSLL